MPVQIIQHHPRLYRYQRPILARMQNAIHIPADINHNPVCQRLSRHAAAGPSSRSRQTMLPRIDNHPPDIVFVPHSRNTPRKNLINTRIGTEGNPIKNIGMDITF